MGRNWGWWAWNCLLTVAVNYIMYMTRTSKKYFGALSKVSKGVWALIKRRAIIRQASPPRNLQPAVPITATVYGDSTEIFWDYIILIYRCESLQNWPKNGFRQLIADLMATCCRLLRIAWWQLADWRRLSTIHHCKILKLNCDSSWLLETLGNRLATAWRFLASSLWVVSNSWRIQTYLKEPQETVYPDTLSYLVVC